MLGKLVALNGFPGLLGHLKVTHRQLGRESLSCPFGRILRVDSRLDLACLPNDGHAGPEDEVVRVDDGVDAEDVFQELVESDVVLADVAQDAHGVDFLVAQDVDLVVGDPGRLETSQEARVQLGHPLQHRLRWRELTWKSQGRRARHA